MGPPPLRSNLNRIMRFTPQRNGQRVGKDERVGACPHAFPNAWGVPCDALQRVAGTPPCVGQRMGAGPQCVGGFAGMLGVRFP